MCSWIADDPDSGSVDSCFIQHESDGCIVVMQRGKQIGEVFIDLRATPAAERAREELPFISFGGHKQYLLQKHLSCKFIGLIEQRLYFNAIQHDACPEIGAAHLFGRYGLDA